MTNRRRANRFVLPQTGEAALRLMQDVFVERASSDSIELLSDAPLRTEDMVTLELPSGHGARVAVSVSVQSSEGVTLGELRRHRLIMRLAPVPPGTPPTGGSARDVAALGRYLPAMGVVIRRVAVQIRDVSTSGCRLDSLEPLPDGCVGLLELPHGSDPPTEAIRICRVSRMPGSPWPWRAGAHFLSLTAPSEASVRNVVARFEILDELQTLPRPAFR